MRFEKFPNLAIELIDNFIELTQLSDQAFGRQNQRFDQSGIIRNLVSFTNLLESLFDQRLAARVMCVKEGANGMHLGSAQVVQGRPSR